MKGLLLAIAVVAGAAAGWACGDNRSDDDAAPDSRSAAIDGPSPDAMDRCLTLCECTSQFCADDMTACVAQCAALDDSVRECRIEHCGYAQTNPSFHCPHALGDPTAPGVPAACIQP